MLNAPENTLPLVTILSPRVCLHFMPDEASDKENLDYLDRVEYALDKVNRPELQTEKNTCLAEIDRVRQLIEKLPSAHSQ